MKKHDKIPTTDTAEIERLLERVRQGKLEPGDTQLIEKLLGAFLELIALLRQKKMRVSRLKDLLFGSKERKKRKSQSEAPAAIAEADQAQRSSSDSSPENSVETKSEEGAEEDAEAATKPKRRGHGRIPASAYTGATIIRLDHPHLKPGDLCPDPTCGGRLHQLRDPNTQLYLTGQPIIRATKYEQSVLRCGICDQRIVASLPAEVLADEKFDPTADVTIALLKYGAGMPFYRQARLQEACGVPLPEAVQFERCEKLADAALPVFLHLNKLAADGKLFHIDDTGVRILSCLAENKDRSETERQGTHTSGIVVKDEAGHRIALYRSSRQHAGENLDEVLKKRSPGLDAPMKMSDASSVNGKKTAPTVDLNCLAHGRGKFKEIEENFPDECRQVLDAIKKTYENDARTKGMSDAQRLAYHQEHSGPVMEQLREWIEQQFEQKKVEPNSGLGKALQYLRNHWSKLTGFLRVPGAPLDNNEVERALKRFVLFRKNSLFYKTDHGAKVGDLLMSLIESCRLNQANPFEYLLALLRNKDEARRNPAAYLPWTYARGRPTEEAEALAA